MDEAAQGSNLGFMVRALAHRNYRWFFGGQIISLLGTWLSSVASSWLVYRLALEEGQPVALMLGLLNFAAQFPLFVFTPLAGVFVDRWNRRSILIGTQALSMVESFALAYFTLSGTITIPRLMALSVCQGLINALDVPTRQSFVIELVERREDLSNAIALNSSMVHSARLFGPAIAGYLIYRVGEGYCFLIDGFSYLAVIGALLAIRVVRRARELKRPRPWASFVEGMRYAFGFRPIRSLLLMVAVSSLAATAQTTLMPIFAGEILHGEERTFGWLLGSAGLGALCGSLYLAARKTVLGLGRVIVFAGLALGLAMILFSSSRSIPLSMCVLVVSGGSLVVQMASSNTILQTLVEDDKRGRIMALYAMAFLGVAPIGSLLAGAVASWFSAPVAMASAGVLSLIVAGTFAWELPKLRPLIRPIYRAKGILPQIAEAMQATEKVSAPPRD